MLKCVFVIFSSTLSFFYKSKSLFFQSASFAVVFLLFFFSSLSFLSFSLYERATNQLTISSLAISQRTSWENILSFIFSPFCCQPFLRPSKKKNTKFLNGDNKFKKNLFPISRSWQYWKVGRIVWKTTPAP